MNLFWPSLAAWAYFSHKARQTRRTDDEIYERAIRDAEEEFSPEQEAYDKWVKGLPTIYGPSTFSLRVNSTSSDEGVVAIYAEYLERRFHLGQAFIAVLKYEPENLRHEFALRVEVSQALFGYLYDVSNQVICEELLSRGGQATCLARICKNVRTGQYSVYLDLDLPLIFDNT